MNRYSEIKYVKTFFSDVYLFSSSKIKYQINQSTFSQNIGYWYLSHIYFFVLTYLIYQFVYQISQPQNNDLIYISTQHNLPNTSNKFIIMFLKIISTLQLATPKMSLYRLS